MIGRTKLVVPMVKALNTSKLVQKEINVSRNGKTFRQMRWVRPAEAEGQHEVKGTADKAWQSASVDWLLDSKSTDNLKPADKKLLVQPTGDIEELYKQAEDMRKPFRAWMEQVKDEVGAAELLSRPVLKSKERVVQKMKADGENDASHIYDIDGHTLVFDDLQGVARALEYFLGHKGTVRVKNNFAHPSALGYRDINVNVRLPNGMISEIQLNTKAMLEAKEKTAHLFYEVSREAEGQCPPPPPPVPYNDTVEAQRAIYGYSWDWSKNQKGFDEASFNASVFDIARPFWSRSMRVLETDAKWLSDKTRNAFQTFGSKTNGLSSTSKNSKSSLSKSTSGIALPPHSKNSMGGERFAIGIGKSIDKGKLSRKLVMVSRAGQTYQAVRWVKPAMGGNRLCPGKLGGDFPAGSMTSNADIARLQNMLKDRKWGKRCVGIRVVDDDYDDYNAKVGDALAPSYRWEEGDYTNERLNGTSAIGMNEKIDPVPYNGYIGRRIQVIGGDYQEWGEDRGEVVIPDAEVLAVYDLPRETRKSLTFSGYKPQGRSKVGKVRLVVLVCR